MLKAHWTPRYFFDRARQVVHERLHPNEPWLVAETVRLLDQLLHPTDFGLEWGSGRSTVWLARRLAHLTSVEHNVEWAARVSVMLDREMLRDKVDYRRIDESDDYVAVVEEFAGQSLDFCLVDGVKRGVCARAVLDKLKPGGILVIDNSHWFIPQVRPSRAPKARTMLDGPSAQIWAEIAERLSGWRTLRATDGVSETTLAVKTES